jgi:hypothetical protein
MLSEEEIQERAKYCYLVSYQLSCLRSLELANPAHYLKVLEKSSLRLTEDEFILMTMEHEFRMGSPDCGLDYLMALYEGFAHAYCEVMEKQLTSIRDQIPGDFLKKLAAEMSHRETEDRIREPE